jgi:hypothetical protein
VPVRTVNVNYRDHVLNWGTVVSHCEPLTWTAAVGDLEHQQYSTVTQGPCKQLQEVISDAKSNLDATVYYRIPGRLLDMAMTLGARIGFTIGLTMATPCQYVSPHAGCR